MTMRLTLPLVVLTALFISVSELGAQECDNQNRISAEQQARRDAAVEYLATVNAAQASSQHAQGQYVTLNEATGLERIPVGFVPRLIFDQWGYLISLKDIFDVCGFALFSDEHGVIYESQRQVSGGTVDRRPAPVETER